MIPFRYTKAGLIRRLGGKSTHIMAIEPHETDFPDILFRYGLNQSTDSDHNRRRSLSSSSDIFGAFVKSPAPVTSTDWLVTSSQVPSVPGLHVFGLKERQR